MWSDDDGNQLTIYKQKKLMKNVIVEWHNGEIAYISIHQHSHISNSIRFQVKCAAIFEIVLRLHVHTTLQNINFSFALSTNIEINRDWVHEIPEIGIFSSTFFRLDLFSITFHRHNSTILPITKAHRTISKGTNNNIRCAPHTASWSFPKNINS